MPRPLLLMRSNWPLQRILPADHFRGTSDRIVPANGGSRCIAAGEAGAVGLKREFVVGPHIS